MSDRWWTATAVTRATPELHQVMRYAQANYARHTDWFLRHRDAGIKILVFLLSADFAITSLYFAGKVAGVLAMVGLAVVGLLSVALTWLAVISCRQSYGAALEHALLVSKTAWAMGWCSPIAVERQSPEDSAVPAASDKSIYVPRYIEDATKASTTGEFVSRHTKKRFTTYFAAKWTLIAIGTISFALAVFASASIRLHMNVGDHTSNHAVQQTAEGGGSP